MLWKITWRHYFHHPWQIILSFIGIALGVAMVVAIDLCNASVHKAIELSSNAITGRATHQIIGGPNGVPEDLYVKLRKNQGIYEIAPIVEGYAKLVSENISNEQDAIFQLMGSDIFSERQFRDHLFNTIESMDITRLLNEPNAAVIAKSAADRLNIKSGDELRFIVGAKERIFHIVGLVNDSAISTQQAVGSMIFVDIATAQEALGMQNFLTQMDLIVEDSPAGERRLEKIKDILPRNLDIVSAKNRSYALSQMTKAFETNLTALSFLALIVGMFLIYNTMTFSVVLRRQVIGSLRAIGVTRREIFRSVFNESLLIGIGATWLGLYIGILLADGLLGLVTRTINDLYFVLNVQSLSISYVSIAKGFLLGVLATAFTVLLPAYEATKSAPRESIARSAIEAKYRKSFRWFGWLGAFFVSVGVITLFIPTELLHISFAGVFAIMLGFTLFVPQLTLALVNAFVPIHHKVLGALGNIAARSVSTSLSRTSIAIASLAVAIATTIGVAVMIDSFRGSVVEWLDNTLRADVFVTAPGISSSKFPGKLSPKWVERFEQLPEVKAISIVHNLQLHAPKGFTELNVIDLPKMFFSQFDLRGDENYEDAKRAFFEEDGVLLSEPYAYRHNLKVGNTLVLPTDNGLKSFKVAGIYVDYGSEQGVVTLNRDAYKRYWDDDSITSLGIHTVAGTNNELFIDVISAIVAEYKQKSKPGDVEQDLLINSKTAIKNSSISVFDRAFVVTEVLRVLAIFVAFVGIVSALMALQFERKAEIALYRALGLTPQEVWLVISGETGLIGMISGLLAIPLGIILALVLILVINRRSFGWSMDITLDPMLFFQSLLLAITAALIAGIIPAFKMSRSNPSAALREE